MTNYLEELHRYDLARRQAMIDADVAALDRLLAENLSWTHSSGVTETKAEFIAALESGVVTYKSLEIEDDTVRGDNSLIVHSGMLRGVATRDGKEKELNAKILSVWRVDRELWRLMAWQSTNI